MSASKPLHHALPGVTSIDLLRVEYPFLHSFPPVPARRSAFRHAGVASWCGGKPGAVEHAADENGFIALITAIILSVSLMTIALALNGKAFTTRAEILGAEFKQRSSAMAEACGDTAILRLNANIGYAGNETIAVGTGSCSIGAVSTDAVANKITIPVHASFHAAMTTLTIVVRSIDLTIISWDEVP